MKNYPDFWNVLLSKEPRGFFFGFFVLALIAAAALVFIELKTRNADSLRSPEKFSFKFWLTDNIARFVGNPLLIFLAIRAGIEYISPLWMLFYSMGVGFGSDGLGILAKRMGILTTSKLAEKITEKINEEKNKA